MSFTPKSEFLHVLEARGFIQDCTDLEGLDELLRKETVSAYVGYDPTGPSAHIGHLVNIMMLRWLQKTGHRPIALMGGGTSRIGDPSGKDESRQLMTEETIAANAASFRRVFINYITFEDQDGSGSNGAIQANNADWLDGLGYIPFLREYGRHFTINRMLTFESVKGRLEREQPLTFLEFNYMLLQAYDFLELYRRTGCRLQMGGSDQWGNIVNGVDLARRIEGVEVFGLVTPLLTTSDGRKMGKTAKGAVWLNADMLAPYDLWQFWRNTTDADVGRFLKLFTELPVDECERLGTLGGAEINEAKAILANEATALAHGRAAAEAAAATARETFAEGGAGAELPVVELGHGDLPVSAAQLFVRAGLAASGKEAKRLIEGGGARLGDRALADPGEMIGAEALVEPQRLSAGKKRHALARLTG
ncbi:MAG: tyrosine--tRNA ligase [Pseudomonadota bacterium]